MIEFDFCVGGGGLRTVYFAGVLKGLLSNKNLKLRYLSLFSGSSFTILPALVKTPGSLLNFISRYSIKDVLEEIPAESDDDYVKALGIYDYSKNFIKVLSSIINQVNGRFSSRKIIIPVFDINKMRTVYKNLSVESAIDTTRLPPIIVPGHRRSGSYLDGGIEIDVPIDPMIKVKKKNVPLITVKFNRMPPATYISTVTKLVGLDMNKMLILRKISEDRKMRSILNRFKQGAPVSHYRKIKKYSDYLIEANTPVSMLPTGSVQRSLFESGFEAGKELSKLIVEEYYNKNNDKKHKIPSNKIIKHDFFTKKLVFEWIR